MNKLTKVFFSFCKNASEAYPLSKMNRGTAVFKLSILTSIFEFGFCLLFIIFSDHYSTDTDIDYKKILAFHFLISSFVGFVFWSIVNYYSFQSEKFLFQSFDFNFKKTVVLITLLAFFPLTILIISLIITSGF